MAFGVRTINSKCVVLSKSVAHPAADSAAAPGANRAAGGPVRYSFRVSELKTKPTEVNAESHIAAIANDEQRSDARTLVALMRRVTRQEPRMWGPSIVGFGSYHYKYASGHEGDSALTGFAARGRELVVYIARTSKVVTTCWPGWESTRPGRYVSTSGAWPTSI